MAIPHFNETDGSDAVSYQNSNGKVGARFDTYGRRRIGTTAAPTVAVVTAGAGTGASAALTYGTDEHGLVTVTGAGTPAIGAIVTVTFAKAYATTPMVMLQAQNTNAATAGVYPTTVGTSSFKVSTVAAIATGACTVAYRVVGGA